MVKDAESVRFIGALGSGMLPLARLMVALGYKVSGADSRAEVRTADIPFEVFREGEGIPSELDLAVYSLAVAESSPEIISALGRGVPLISRAQLLAALMSEYPVRVSVSGTHGKSTVTAMIDAMLSADGDPVTTVPGATLVGGAGLRIGRGEIFLAEACEYRDSFLCLCPTLQLISSVELDHTDYFDDISALRASFLKAAMLAETVIVNSDDSVASSICDEVRARGDKRVITYGTASSADYRLSYTRGGDGEYTVRIDCPQGRAELSTRLIGEYDLMNMTAAVAAVSSLGRLTDGAIHALASYGGIERRSQKICEIDGAPVFYDYAHHPTEIGAVIKALKDRYGSVLLIFRPHTYSRTKSLWDDFKRQLSKADFTILLDIYPAREDAILGVTSERLASELGGLAIRSSMEDAASIALSRKLGSIALVGAGDVEKVKRDLIELGNTDKKEIRNGENTR